MDTKTLVARLLIDGCVRVPGVLSPREVEEMRAAFERVALRTNKRWFDWSDICGEPEFVSYIAHPNLMAVVDAFVNHLGHEAVFANSAGSRDAFNPQKPDIYNPPNLRHGPIGWHDDVQGMKNPNPDMLQSTLTSLLYLDETFADNGAYCSAVGSHHLAGISTEHKPVVANSDLVLDLCELRPLPVKPGDVIIHRGHHWHGVVPPSVMRRLMIQTFSTKKQYDIQMGHTQLSDATVAMIAPERKKYLQWYAKK